MANTKREKLFTEFPPVPTEKWEEVITADLKGADYERKLVWRTGEGFNVRPYYRAENLEGIRFLGSQAGEFPYVRGTRSHNRWRVHQTVEVKCPREANAEALKLLNSGVDSLGFSIAKEGFTAEELDQLLAGTAMVGDSEQYASAMALMARSLGLPSRVVLGFLPKDDEGEISENRTEKQGKNTVTEFTGNDVTAWVEIKLDGYGWVAFYPTPKETKVPDENQNLTPPNPQTLVRQPPVPLTDPLRDDAQARGKSSIGGSMADETSINLFWQHFGRIARKIAIYGSPLWTLLIVCGLLLAIKAIALARSRKHGSAQQRVAAGWQSVAALARQSGLDIQGTRSEQAISIASQMDISCETLLALGAQADYAAFSGNTVNEEHVQQYWHDIAQERKYMLKSLPTLRRWRAKLSLADVFHFRGKHGGSVRQSASRRGNASAVRARCRRQ